MAENNPQERPRDPKTGQFISKKDIDLTKAFNEEISNIENTTDNAKSAIIDLQNQIKELVNISDKAGIQTSNVFKNIGSNISTGLKQQIREAASDVTKFGINASKELKKISPDFTKLSEQSKDLADTLILLTNNNPALNKTFKEVIITLKSLSNEYEKNTEKSKSFKDIVEGFSEEILKTADSYTELEEQSRVLLTFNDDIVDSFRELIKESKTLGESSKITLRSLTTQQRNAIKDTSFLITSFETDSKKLNKQLFDNEDLIKRFSIQVTKLKDDPETLQEGLELEAILDTLILSNDQLKNFKEKISEVKSLKFSDNFDKFAYSIPILGPIIRDNIITPFKKGVTEAIASGATSAEAFKAGIRNIGKTIVFALGVLAVESLFKVNQQITDLQKNLGISSAQAQNLRAGFAQTAANANDLFINSTKIQQSFIDFSETLGFAVENSGQVLETFTNLTGRFGLNNEQASKLTSILGLQDKNTEQVLNNTIKTINASRSSGKEFFNTKQIIQDISNISFNVIATLGKSPDILAKAATRARELGLNLDQVEKIADSLLNFESSISAELTAELLTGKQLNLERARFLALNNDIEGVMEEINKQGINFTEFSKMNRIAQEGLANALGMSRAEMTEMLFKQEQQALAQKASRGELDEQTLAQFKALSAQEKFNSAVEKAKSAFADLVIVLSPIIDTMAYLADIVGAVFDNFSKVGGAIGGLLSPLNQASTTTKEIKDTTAELGKLIVVAGVAYGVYKTTLGTIRLLQEGINAKKKIEVALEIVQQAVRTKGVALLIAAGAGIAAYAILNRLEKSVEKRAKGGPISAGKPYLVGEEGPELIVPNSSGQVISNGALNNMQPLIDRLDTLERTLIEYRSVPVVIENNIDGKKLNENTIKGLRKGYLTTPSVYT